MYCLGLALITLSISAVRGRLAVGAEVTVDEAGIATADPCLCWFNLCRSLRSWCVPRVRVLFFATVLDSIACVGDSGLGSDEMGLRMK